MKAIILAGGLALAVCGSAIAQDGERRCCHVTEGVWLDGTYTPAACEALGRDYAPQGDARTAMCTSPETTDIPGNPPGAPGSPGGGDSGDGDGDGAGGGGDGSGGGAGVHVPESETVSLAEERFDYETVGRASLPELGGFLDRANLQRDLCDQLAGGRAGAAMPDMGATCFSNLRGNVHLVTQNASRMRNDRTLDESERHEAVHITQQAGAIRDHADAMLHPERAN